MVNVKNPHTSIKSGVDASVHKEVPPVLVKDVVVVGMSIDAGMSGETTITVDKSGTNFENTDGANHAETSKNVDFVNHGVSLHNHSPVVEVVSVYGSIDVVDVPRGKTTGPHITGIGMDPRGGHGILVDDSVTPSTISKHGSGDHL